MGESSDRQLRGDAQTHEDKAVPHWGRNSNAGIGSVFGLKMKSEMREQEEIYGSGIADL